MTDTGLLVGAALSDPSIKDERILAMAEPFNSTRFIDILGKIRPEKKHLLPAIRPDAPQDLTEVDCGRAKEILRKHKGGNEDFKSLETALREFLDSCGL